MKNNNKLKLISSSLGMSLVLVTGTTACVLWSTEYNKNINENINNQRVGGVVNFSDSYNLVVINNGEYIRLNNIQNNENIDNSYNIAINDNNSFVAYVYGGYLNDSQSYISKDILTDYIVSNITINEDNTVSFDESIITEENYNKYLNDTILSNKIEPQRIRN